MFKAISGILSICLLIMVNTTQDPYKLKRERMVRNHIRARGITDELVLKAMVSVKRHLFVPEAYQSYAYDDNPLFIGYEQTISQPYIVAYMTENLELKPDYKVLEIGTGSGYQAAILGKIVKEVYTIEIVEELGKTAREKLIKQNYNNVKVKIGDGYNGWQEHAPYDAIIVTAAPSKVPQPLLDQLKDGGKMIIPVGEQSMVQYLLLIEKDGNKTKTKKLIPVRFVPFTRK
ncbi:protein-L-isoaspartate(D-aspartate) O-methyltransferase [Bacteroidota bacterium]